MTRALILTLALVVLAGPSARAQFNFVGPGSTVEGDYLRGVGVAAFGMGIYNQQTAIANSINADTAMRVNEYIYAALMNENKMNAVHRAAQFQRAKDLFKQTQDRINNSPEARDVDNGGALNAVLKQINDPRISESFSRSAAVPLSADEVRRIPFKLGEKGVTRFSMQRLTAKGKNRWPVAFQDKRFDHDRQAFEKALDNALEQQIEGKMQISAIEAVDRAVENLSDRLKKVVGAIADPLYLEGKNYLDELRSVVTMLKTHQIEVALGELDHYAGTTVGDLRAFMRTHNLQFAPAKNQEERALYPELFAKLSMHRDKVTTGLAVPGNDNK